MSNNKRKNTNKQSAYKPKTAGFNAKSGNKTISATASSNNGEKKVEATVSKNGSTIKQTTITTKNAEGSAHHTNQNSASHSHDFTETKSASHINKPHYTKNWSWWLICLVLGALAIGGIARLLGGNMDHFNAHILPPGVVPRWVFGLAWPILYTMLGISAFLVFFSPNQLDKTRRGDIIWFSLNLLLNMLWPLLFYRLDLLIVSCVLIGLIVITAIITNYRFYYRNLAAGILYSFYTAWLCYALYLNLAIALLNA
ncbi:MAG: tryptophan-rich sensory protein [Clostridia bacterium]|nr:tryptophan-rich sensory protein [Clostridia bacterium]